MFKQLISWYKKRHWFWKIVLFVFVVVLAILLFVFTFLRRPSMAKEIILSNKHKTDRQVARYDAIAVKEEGERDKINVDLNKIREEKKEVMKDHATIMEKLDGDCSTAELRVIAAQLRKRDKKQF